ncbi:MAG: hypothetical protein HY721_33765, partial [Planctomycetes bacterium]|nr:hypothetical protein [Planctomycetota bacterium]
MLRPISPGVVALALGLVCGRPAALRSADFVRGDANQDGRITVADPHFVFGHIFRTSGDVSCDKALDFDDNGRVQLTDAVRTLMHLFEDRPAPPQPFPDPGPDPTDDDLPCESYGGGQAIDDAAAEMRVLDAVAEGGTNPRASLVVSLSSTRSLGGYAGAIEVAAGAAGAGGVIDHLAYKRDLTGTDGRGYFLVRLDRTAVTFAYVTAFTEAYYIAPGRDAPALEVVACLRGGLAAGRYPMTLAAGDLADGESGRAVAPRLRSGTLTVLSDVAAGLDCPVEPTPPPLIDKPERTNVAFLLGGTPEERAQPAEAVPMIVQANVPLEGLDFSIDFDEDLLDLAGIEPAGGEDWESFVYTIDDRDARPGAAGVDEGYVTGRIVFGLEEGGFLEASRATEVLRLRFDLQGQPGRCAGARFADGGELVSGASREPIRNAVRALGQEISPQNARSFVLEGTSWGFSSGGVQTPEELEAEFGLASVRGAPGFPVRMPFSILSNAATQGFAFSIDFDEEVLRGTRVEQVHRVPDGKWDFWQHHIDNGKATPGSAGVDEGYVAGAAVFGFLDACGEIPSGRRTDVLALHFEVDAGATAAVTEVRFLDGGRSTPVSQPVHNVITALGQSVEPELASSFVFLNGLVNIAPDIAVFVGGDSNGDAKVDISDARHTLGYLFLGEGPPACYDAADAGDDGRIDVSD